jgi:hypothetical protein
VVDVVGDDGSLLVQAQPLPLRLDLPEVGPAKPSPGCLGTDVGDLILKLLDPGLDPPSLPDVGTAVQQAIRKQVF